MNSSSNGRTERIVIAGGGLAGQRCAEMLRRQGYEGTITIVCAEPHPPYDRPPLSKELLAGEGDGATPAFRPGEWYEQQSVDLLQGVSASKLLPGERRLRLSDRTELRYDWLLIATGSRPRTLPMLDRYENVSVLRTVDDCARLRGVLQQRPRLAIVGAGFVGQEVAATARKLGAEVTMIEAAPAPLTAVLGDAIGGWFAELHRAEGVEVITTCTVDRAEGNGIVQRLALSNGESLEPDHVLVGVGVEPDIGWLTGTDLHAPGGVEVDPHGRTAVDRVLAAGDAAATFDPRLGRHVPGSHWEAAGRQGARAARVMLGLDPGPAPVTSFWTDQYGIRIQYLGHARIADSVNVDGDPTSRNFAVTYTRAGRPVAALLVDRARALPEARQFIEKGTTWAT